MTVEQLASPHPNLRVERDGFVVTVTIDRPATKNACTGEMWISLGSIFAGLAYSGSRAIVLTGAGGNFCTGAELGQSSEGRWAERQPTMLDSMRALADAVQAIHSCQVPVIAKVDGLCVGAGLGLALAADLTWCSQRSSFAAIFVKRGLSLDFGTSWLLRERVGVHVAKELALTGEFVSGEQAASLGLVNRCVADDALDEAVAAITDAIASGPPGPISINKRLLNQAGGVSLAQALEAEALAQSLNVTTTDMREAMNAWFEKRSATYTGR